MSKEYGTIQGQPILALPIDLRERRSVLEDELSKTIQELIATELKERLQNLVSEAEMEDTPKKITWEFHPESDDEGGTDWWIYYLQVHGENDIIDAEEITYMKKSRWSDAEYEVNLNEDLHDILSDYRDDLHHYGIEEILL